MRLVALQESAIQVFQSSLFNPFPDLVYGFSTRHGTVSAGILAGLNLGAPDVDNPERVAQNRNDFFHALGIPVHRVAEGRQIHSANVSVIHTPRSVPDCDALITDQADLYLTIKTADCFALLIYDAVQRVVAAVHAGWRGIHRGVIQHTIRKMQQEFGTQAKDLYITVGPGALSCCYEVQPDVADLFPGEASENRNGHIYLDLEAAIDEILTELRVPAGNREMTHRCTVCEADNFYSYRRDGKQSGRMLAVIGMRGNQYES